MKPVALIADRDFYPNASISRLEQFFEVRSSTASSQGELFDELAALSAEVLFCNLSIKIDSRILKASANLLYIVSPATGMSHFDLGATQSKDVKILSLLDLRDQIQDIFATAELAWGLIISVSRKIIASNLDLLNGRLDRRDFLGRDLHGRTLGVIGFGRLGRRVATYGLAFGMKVVVYEIDESKRTSSIAVEFADSVEQMFGVADVVSVHIPLTEENYHFIDSEKIRRLKHGAIFINTSRGEIVDECALVTALEDGKLFGVGADVLSIERSPNRVIGESDLIRASQAGLNVVLTPHIGGWADFSVAKARNLIVDEFLNRYLKSI